MKINLTDGKKISFEEVLFELEHQKEGTVWAKETNSWAIDLAKKFNKLNNGDWQKGLIHKEDFLKILLPNHSHDREGGGSLLLFPKETSISQAYDFYKKRDKNYNENCINLINELKNKIEKEGMTHPITLGIKDGRLYSIDGLHRDIAVVLLMKENKKEIEVPVLLSQKL